jgi:uncharacterized membrane protein
MRRDLTFVVGLACAGLLAALLPTPVWLRAVLLLPLVLALPGYALAANFFAPATIGASERLVYTVALSIATTAIGGLLTQIAFGLGRDLWAVLLVLVTVCASVRMMRGQPRITSPRLRAPWAMLPAALVFLLAGLVAALAILSADHGLHDAQAKIRFTSFWLLPGKATAASEGLSVGLRSHEGTPTNYTLRLSQEGRPFLTRTVSLHTGEVWERSLSLSATAADAPVIATLSREGIPYRRLSVASPR